MKGWGEWEENLTLPFPLNPIFFSSSFLCPDIFCRKTVAHIHNNDVFRYQPAVGLHRSISSGIFIRCTAPLDCLAQRGGGQHFCFCLGKEKQKKNQKKPKTPRLLNLQSLLSRERWNEIDDKPTFSMAEPLCILDAAQITRLAAAAGSTNDVMGLSGSPIFRHVMGRILARRWGPTRERDTVHSSAQKVSTNGTSASLENGCTSWSSYLPPWFPRSRGCALAIFACRLAAALLYPTLPVPFPGSCAWKGPDIVPYREFPSRCLRFRHVGIFLVSRPLRSCLLILPPALGIGRVR